MVHMLAWLMDKHFLPFFFSLLSAGLWIGSAYVKSRVKPHTAVLTLGENMDPVDLHNLVLSLQLQSRYNGYAAICAAIAIITQLGGA